MRELGRSRMGLLAKMGVFAGMLLGGTSLVSSSANAIAVTMVDGIQLPLIMAPGGNYIQGQLNRGVLLDGILGERFFGLGQITDIADSGGKQTYVSRFNIDQGTGDPVSAPGLWAVFDNFLIDNVLLPTAITPGRITFTGGSLNYYTFGHALAAQPNVNTTDALTDLANAAAGNLWLSLTPDAVDALGHTLVITVPANNSLSSFKGALVEAFLDVDMGTGLAANDYFHTCPANGFVNPTGSGGCSDVHFIGAIDTGVSGDFGVSGHDTMKARNNTSIPEPGSLLLLAAGLAMFAGVRLNRPYSRA